MIIFNWKYKQRNYLSECLMGTPSVKFRKKLFCIFWNFPIADTLKTKHSKNLN